MIPRNEISGEIKEKILVAGDDEIETILLCEYLRQEKYEVSGPYSYNEVRAHFFEQKYAFLFACIENSEQLAVFSRLPPLCPSTVFISIVEREKMLLGFDSLVYGFDIFIMKPIKLGILGEIMSRARLIHFNNQKSGIISALKQSIRNLKLRLDNELGKHKDE